jgi:antitoxin ParD1/3/4
MATIERISITLPSEMVTNLRHTVEGGQYASASEIIREALREWTRRRDDELRDLETLRAAVKLGDESGPGVPADEVFAELRRMIARRRAAVD